jgi:hypothetical protein
MREITAGLFISLDRVVENPQNWTFPYHNEELGSVVDAQLGAADTLPPRGFADYAAETAATGVWTRTDQSSPGSPR